MSEFKFIPKEMERGAGNIQKAVMKNKDLRIQGQYEKMAIRLEIAYQLKRIADNLDRGEKLKKR